MKNNPVLVSVFDVKRGVTFSINLNLVLLFSCTTDLDTFKQESKQSGAHKVFFILSNDGNPVEMHLSDLGIFSLLKYIDRNVYLDRLYSYLKPRCK